MNASERKIFYAQRKSEKEHDGSEAGECESADQAGEATGAHEAQRGRPNPRGVGRAARRADGGALCRHENLHQNIYYSWLKEFMEAGKGRLLGEETRGASRGDVSKMQQVNEALRQAVADLTVEVRTLKKSLF